MTCDDNFGLIDGLRGRLDDWIEQSEGALRADLRAMATYMDGTKPQHLAGRMMRIVAGKPEQEYDL